MPRSPPSSSLASTSPPFAPKRRTHEIPLLFSQSQEQQLLVERIILTAWRLQRVGRIETEMINDYMRYLTQNHALPVPNQLRKVMGNSVVTTTMLVRYENSTDRMHRRLGGTPTSDIHEGPHAGLSRKFEPADNMKS